MAVSSSALAAELALHFIEARPDPSKSSPGLNSQIQHRLQIVQFWDIAPSSRVLELGCGQGDTTIALAHAVGPTGHVDAIDPGSPDYGTPPLKDAHGHILSSPIGSRISFHHSTATAYAESYSGPEYDYIVLAHSIWYFENPSILPGLLLALKPHLAAHTKLCVAEWALAAAAPSSVPHVWTALLRSLLEAKRPQPSTANIRAVLSPAQISKLVTARSELALLREGFKETNDGMKDGFWEVGYTLRKRAADMKRLEETGVSESERTQVDAYFDSLQNAVDRLGEKGVEGVRCMDFWVAVFGRRV
jgi:SAM-dependent methyltransferase